MSRVPYLLAALLLPACLEAKDDAKGVVDDSTPPSIPGESGKADDPAHAVAFALESPHPYTNNVDRKFHVDLVAKLPACSQQARVHFSILRTEANYDYVDLEVGGAIVQSLDGTHDNTWSSWFDVTSGGLDVHLTTDGSVTRHGFVIDQLEWAGGAPHCPPLVGCTGTDVEVMAPSAACSCPAQPTCVPLADVRIDHVSSMRFLHTGHRVEGTAASNIGTGPTDGTVYTPVGTIPADRLQSVITLAEANGVLFAADYDLPIDAGAQREVLVIHAGAREVTFSATQGKHTPAVAAVIAAFEALFVCDGANASLTCGDDFACTESTCAPDETCSCDKSLFPVCGLDGRTYDNACLAGCAEVDVSHDGACGQVGDQCGGILGQSCTDANKCRYATSTWSAPYPDAAGACVARTYCDAPADCNGLPAPAVLGAWACETNVCAFHAGPNWREVTGGRFTTTHPYANSTSVWKELYLPAEAQALRLIVNGAFKLERNYDYFEVWTWTNGAWTLAKRYTGTTGPASTESWTGRYFYLRFVSDSSVTDQGFDITPQWR